MDVKGYANPADTTPPTLTSASPVVAGDQINLEFSPTSGSTVPRTPTTSATVFDERASP